MLSTKKFVLMAFLGLGVMQVSAMEPSCERSGFGGMKRVPSGDLAGMTTEEIARLSAIAQLRVLELQLCDLENKIAHEKALNAPGAASKAFEAVCDASCRGFQSTKTFLTANRGKIPGTNQEVTVAKGLGVAAAVAGLVAVGKKGYLERPVGATKGFVGSICGAIWSRVPAMPKFGAKKTK